MPPEETPRERLVRAEEGVKHMSREMQRFAQRIDTHMTKEEAAFKALYERIDAMDDELKKSFQARDKSITDLRIAQTRMLAWAAAGFAVLQVVVSILVQLLKPILVGLIA